MIFFIIIMYISFLLVTSVYFSEFLSSRIISSLPNSTTIQTLQIFDGILGNRGIFEYCITFCNSHLDYSLQISYQLMVLWYCMSISGQLIPCTLILNN